MYDVFMKTNIPRDAYMSIWQPYFSMFFYPELNNIDERGGICICFLWVDYEYYKTHSLSIYIEDVEER